MSTTALPEADVAISETLQGTASEKHPAHLAARWPGMFHGDGATPGLLEIFQLLGERPDLLPVFQRGGYLAHHKIVRLLSEGGHDFDILRPDAGEASTYPTLFGPGWPTRLINYFMGFYESESSTAETWLPITIMHLPKPSGSSSALKVEVERSSGASFKISALGFAGGGGFTRSIKSAIEVGSKMTSLELCVQGEVKTAIHVNGRGERIVVATVKSISNRLQYFDVEIQISAEDTKDIMKECPTIRIPPSADEETRFTESVKLGSKHEFSRETKFPIGALGDSTIVLTIESEVTGDETLTYKVPPGHRYGLWRPQKDSHVVFVLSDE